MDAVRLAQELARRMSHVVPAEVRIIAEGDMVWFDSALQPARAGTYACQWLYKGIGAYEDLLTEACWRALDDLQDFVSEITTSLWPGRDWKSGARIDGAEVLLFYGDPQRPVLRLESLPLGP